MSDSKSLIDKIEEDISVQEENLAKKNQRKEKGKYTFIGVLLICGFIGLIIMAGSRYIPKFQYNEAIKLIGEEKYREATVKLNKISHYNNADFLLKNIYLDHPQYKLLDLDVGNTVEYGVYNRNDDIAEIEWTVLEKNNDKVLLISKNIIDAKSYKDENDPSFTMTKWLNDTFKKTAFDKAELKAITEVFLLSKDQIETYLEGNEFAATTPTQFAMSQDGYEENYSDDYMWWTSDATSETHYIVGPGGYAGSHVAKDTSTEGIRPAIWVSIE